MKYVFSCLALCVIHTTLQAQLTYKDVAGIFFSRCTSCHHAGGAGPFPLMGYMETANQSAGIEDALINNIMPPWSPDTSYTRFLHERIITDAEKNAILSWIGNGSPAGDTSLAPPPPVYSGYQLNGTPTLELQIPAFTSNATNDDSYICFSLPTNLMQDRYLRAFEVVPGNPSIVHHVLLNVDTVGNTVNDLSGTCYTLPGDYGLGGFAPGAPPTVFPGQLPLKLGIRIKAGSRIVLQLHYPAGSAGMIDSTKVRLYFYPVNEPNIRPVTVFTPLQNWTMFIPPDSVQTYSASFPPLPLDVSVLATFPHSHLICTQIINYARSGVDTIPLIRINDWDFEWQGYYNYRYPVRIPAGYTLEGRHTYDNTSGNPNNPHFPPQLITAGLSTTDEMFFDGYQLTYYLPGDELIDIAAILATDSLLSGMPAPSSALRHEVQVYPNPSAGSLYFRLEGFDATAKIDIFDGQGRPVDQIRIPHAAQRPTVVEWTPPPHTAGSGLYFYRVTGMQQSLSGKFIRVNRTD